MIVLVSVQKHLCKLWISLQFCILTNEFSQIEEVWKSHNDLLKKEVWVQWIQPGLCLSLNIWKHCFLPEKRQALACRAHPQPLFVSHHDELHCASISPTRPQPWSGGKSAFFTSFQVIFMQFKVWELLLERLGKKKLYLLEQICFWVDVLWVQVPRYDRNTGRTVYCQEYWLCAKLT